MTIMWQTYRGIFSVLPTGAKLMPSTVLPVTVPPPPARPSVKPSAPPPSSKPASSGHPPPPPPPPLKPTQLKPVPPPATASRPPPAGAAAVVKVARYQQCGGIAGSPVCEPRCLDAPWAGVGCAYGSCKRVNMWYHQCL